MNESRLQWTDISPKAYQAMAGVSAITVRSSLGPVLMELVQTHVSQLNGCAFFLDLHARDLRKQGETWKGINSLATWRETGLYSKRVRAALSWAETLTRLAGEHDAAFAAPQGQFNEQEVVDFT